MQLTIVIPHYNLPDGLLQRCIESITALQIPHDEYEIIVVDDGSTNPPRQTIATFNASNIRLIECPHACQGAARNKGMKEARGRYIQFVDADDTLRPGNALQQCLEKIRRDNPDILRFGYTECQGDKPCDKPYTKKVKFGNTISGAAYMERNNIGGMVWNCIIKNEFIIKRGIRFSTGIFHEDEEFCTAIYFHAQTIIKCDAPIYNYCIREGSTIYDNKKEATERRLADLLTVLEKTATLRAVTTLHSNSIQKRALQRKMATLVADIIYNNMKAGKGANHIHMLCTTRIATHKLYPIPDGRYGIKFKLFRLLANNKTGLRILQTIVSTLTKNHRK